jgi:acyl-CoA synthetase (NDP forming)
MTGQIQEVDSHSRADLVQTALEGLMSPKVVAVFGVSADPVKLGNVILGNVLKNGFEGRVYGVARTSYPAGTPPFRIDGATIVGSFDDIPEVVDVALFAVPAQHLLEALKTVRPGQLKVGIALASGFSETGEEGKRMEDVVREHCAKVGLALIGPNCQGVVVPQGKLQMTFSPMYDCMVSGKVAIISQSGAMGGYMANRLMQRGVGLSCFISSGNEITLTSTDYIAALNRDPATRVILCYLEQITDGRRFAAAVRGLDPDKRLVVVKSGRSSAGSAAVSSHTGGIAVNDKVVDGVFRQLGIIRALDSASAVDAVTVIAAGKQLRGNRVGLLSVAGGLAVELADLLEMHGFEVPEFDPATRASLREIVPAFGATRNPIDLTGAVLTQETLFEDALQVFAAASNIDGFAIISTYIRNPRYAEAIVRMFNSTDKPVVVCWTGNVQQTPESLAILAQAGVPVYDNTARVATAFRALRRDPSIG